MGKILGRGKAFSGKRILGCGSSNPGYEDDDEVNDDGECCSSSGVHFSYQAICVTRERSIQFTFVTSSCLDLRHLHQILLRSNLS